jgi:YVTN family beta-propeller protein
MSISLLEAADEKNLVPPTIPRCCCRKLAITLQTCSPGRVEFTLLGPVAAGSNGKQLALGGPRQRALLALLLLRANEIVSRDRLVEGLWGERAPEGARRSLDSYVSRLRAVLDSDRIVRQPPGYVIRVDEGELDLAEFRALTDRGRAASSQGDAAAAARCFRQALALWKGAALANVLDEPFASVEADRLEEERLVAIEERIAADLDLGGSAELVPELEGFVEAYPFREQLVLDLMLALYRSGRQAEALDAYQACRRRLSDELGLEPMPELQQLQRRILQHDRAIGRPPRSTNRETAPQARSRRRSIAVGAVVALVLAAGVVVGLASSSTSPFRAPTEVKSSQLLGLSRVGAVEDAEVVGGIATSMTSGLGFVWLADPTTGKVTRFDLTSRRVADTVPVGGTPSTVAVGAGSVWTSSVPGSIVVRIDPATGSVTQKISLRGIKISHLDYGSGGVWVGDLTDSSLIELDPRSGEARRTILLPLRPTSFVIDGNVIWVADYDDGSVARIDRRSGRALDTVRVGNGPSALTSGQGAVWVVNTLDSTVSRIDPEIGAVVATIPVGSGPIGAAVAGGKVWVANRYSESVSAIDPVRNAVVRTSRLGGEPTALTAANDRPWVAVSPLQENSGGTLVLLHQRPISIDPAVQADLLPLVADRLTRDGLVSFNLVPGQAGLQIVPDLAVAVPAPTDEGRTFTFRLRPTIRYSDGRLVRADDFRRAVERAFRVGSDYRPQYAAIRGVGRCTVTRCDLSKGIVTDERLRTVTFRLDVADPDFLWKLAFNQSSAPVPPGTPNRTVGYDEPIPGAGPYKIERASTREIRYVRNPRFREWSHAAQPGGNPDEIVMRFGLSPLEEARTIEQGRADWMADNLPAQLLPGLRLRRPSQLHAFSIPTTDFMQFNTNVRPFNDVRVRRALSLAINRRAIARLYGGPDVATPTCQILAPGMVGYRPYCPHARGQRTTASVPRPDLAEARRLVSESAAAGMPVTVWGWTDDPTVRPPVTRYIARTLRSLGFPTRVHLVRHADVRRRDLQRIQLIPTAWGADTPYGFFSTWFTCAGPGNHGWFCDRTIDRRIEAARTLAATNPRGAAAAWAAVDRAIVDAAAAMPMINEHLVDFVSSRLRNYQAHPYQGLIASQVSVR